MHFYHFASHIASGWDAMDGVQREEEEEGEALRAFKRNHQNHNRLHYSRLRLRLAALLLEFEQQIEHSSTILSGGDTERKRNPRKGIAD